MGRMCTGLGIISRVECMLCGDECESVVHMLWECSTYSTCRDNIQGS